MAVSDISAARNSSGFSFAPAGPATAPAPGHAGGALDDLTFSDVMSAINPLQYLPVVGTIYRAATGDEGSPWLRAAVSLVSGVALGGPVGLLTSALGVLACQVLHLDRQVLGALHDGSAGSPAGLPAAVGVASVATRDRPRLPEGPDAAAVVADPAVTAAAAAVPAPLAAAAVAAYRHTLARAQDSRAAA